MDSKKFVRVARAILSRDFDFEAPSHRTSSGLALFIVGMGVGLIAGILFAPVSGEQLRSDLSERTRENLAKIKPKAQPSVSKERTPSETADTSQQRRPAS